MKYYIDFDNTIFNTVLFYQDLEKLMIKYGISKSNITEYQMNHSIYDPIELIELLEKNKKEKIYLDIENLFKKNNYLYKDVIPFLKEVKDHGNIPILYTYGSYKYQKFKIDHSNVSQYFNDMIITSTPKYLEKIDYQNSIFIDDNPFVIKKLSDNGAKKIIRIKRDNNKYSKVKLIDSKIVEYKTMTNIIITS